MRAFDLVVAGHVLFYCEDILTGVPGSEACIKAWWKICVQYLWWRAYERSQ